MSFCFYSDGRWEEGERLHSTRRFDFIVPFPTGARVPAQSWWGEVCPCEGALNPEQQRLCPPQPQDCSESAGRLFFHQSFAPPLHNPRSLSSCCLWANHLPLTDENHYVGFWLWSWFIDNQNGAQFSLPIGKIKRLFWAEFRVREYFHSVCSAFTEVCKNTFLQRLYFGLFQHTMPAAVVFSRLFHTWQSLIKALAFSCCG